MIVHCCILNELLFTVAGRRKKLRNDHLNADGLFGLAVPFLFMAIVAACDLLQACKKNALGTCVSCGTVVVGLRETLT